MPGANGLTNTRADDKQGAVCEHVSCMTSVSAAATVTLRKLHPCTPHSPPHPHAPLDSLLHPLNLFLPTPTHGLAHPTPNSITAPLPPDTHPHSRTLQSPSRPRPPTHRLTPPTLTLSTITYAFSSHLLPFTRQSNLSLPHLGQIVCQHLCHSLHTVYTPAALRHTLTPLPLITLHPPPTPQPQNTGVSHFCAC